MKNITVSVDEETYRRARIRAAELDTSVSALVRAYLEMVAEKPSTGSSELSTPAVRTVSKEEFERLERLEKETHAKIKGFSGGDRVSRDELYERRS